MGPIHPIAPYILRLIASLHGLQSLSNLTKILAIHKKVLTLDQTSVAVCLLHFQSRYIPRTEQRMHIHSNPLSTQMMSPTQSTQQATAVRRAAAEVRRKLTNLAATQEDDAVSSTEAYAEADPDRRRKPQQDETAFRSVFFSASA
jgi:hypothetical protein